MTAGVDLGPCARCDEPATVQVTDAPGNVRCDVHADAIGLGPSLKNSHFSLGFDSGRATLVERITSLEADLQACREAGMVFEEERRRQFKQLLLATEVCEAARAYRLAWWADEGSVECSAANALDAALAELDRLMAVYPTLAPDA